MICSNTGSVCSYWECPMYLGANYCLLVIDRKEKLNILTQTEKQLLTKLRKEGDHVSGI